MESTATIFDIQHGSFVDGPGIRTTVFFKGCNLRCAWCHNPESQLQAPQLLFYAEKCTHCGRCRTVCPSPDHCIVCGKCAEICPNGARERCGQARTLADVLAEVESDRAFYGADGGVTCSGGECMLQPDFLAALLHECRARGIHTAVDTAGDVPPESLLRIAPDADLFLYDVKCMDDARHRQYTGVGNVRILRNLAMLLDRGGRVWIRVPVIPGVNDDPAEMRQLKAFLDAHGGAERVELLPYHAMGTHKYAALGRTASAFSVPSAETMASLRRIFDAT